MAGKECFYMILILCHLLHKKKLHAIQMPIQYDSMPITTLYALSRRTELEVFLFVIEGQEQNKPLLQITKTDEIPTRTQREQLPSKL